MIPVVTRPTSATTVTVEEAVVPPLDGEIEGIADDLTDIHYGIDLIRDGLLAIAQAQLTRQQTLTVLTTLGGSEGADVVSLLAAVTARLTNPDTNPALAGPTGLDPATADNVRRIGQAITCDVAYSWPRDLVNEAIEHLAPHPLL